MLFVTRLERNKDVVHKGLALIFIIHNGRAFNIAESIRTCCCWSRVGRHRSSMRRGKGLADTNELEDDWFGVEIRGFDSSIEPNGSFTPVNYFAVGVQNQLER